MSNFGKKCEEYFQSKDFYEILKIERNATKAEIKKAYHRLSLLVHPDRVDESQKLLATEKFKVLSRIHATLQDSNKRKIYDEHGEYDEDRDVDFNWLNYWRSLFKEITKEDIENYEREYIGSETELRDIKKAYVAYKGKMDLVLEFIPFSNPESEPRIMEIIKKMVENNEVVKYDCFFNEPRKNKLKRMRKWEKEKRLSAKHSEDFEKEMLANRKKREANFGSLLANLEAKYCKQPKKRIKGSEEPAKNTRKTRSSSNK